jgi:hypothetical protein
MREPDEPRDKQQYRHEKIQSQTDDVMCGVDTQQLLSDAAE